MIRPLRRSTPLPDPRRSQLADHRSPFALSICRDVAAGLWLLLALLCAGNSALAAPSPAELIESPVLHIESIEVEGLRRAKPELVVAESLLQEGESYSERELQQAVFRLQRLPFVLDANFSLAKGSRRGTYRLLIQIDEIRRFFFGEDVIYTRFTNSVSFDSLLGQNFTVTPGGLAGIRFFVGKYGMAFGSVSSRGGLQAGYTQYNLFNRRAFLSLGLTNQGCCPIQIFPLGIDPTFGSWRNEDELKQWQLTFGLPFQRRFQLRAQIGESFSDAGQRRNLLGMEAGRFTPRASLDYEDLQRFRAELAVLYDSTDDPVFPIRGIQWTLALDAQRVTADLFVFDDPILQPVILLPAGQSSILPTFESEQIRLAATLGQHFPISRRQTVSLSARLAVGRGEITDLPVLEPISADQIDPNCRSVFCPSHTLRLVPQETLDLLEGYFTARYSLDLWGRAASRKRGDLRWENTLEFGYDRVSPSLDLADNPLYRKSITTSVVFRNSWGVFRFSLQITDYGRGF